MQRSFYCSRNDRLARIARQRGHKAAVRGNRMVVTIEGHHPDGDFRSLMAAAGTTVTVFSVDASTFKDAKREWLK